MGTVAGPFAPGHAANPATAAGEGIADGGTSTGSVDAETERLRAVQACAQPRTTILDQPDGGVVFNNAMTSADAGFIDRTQDTIDALVAQSHRFRCCFDLWASEHPGERGQLVLLLELSPKGQVRGASIDETRSNIEHSDTTACVLDVARAIDYPPSPTGKTTLVEYPFRIGDRSS